MKKQEQKNLPLSSIRKTDTATYFGKPASGFRDRLFVIIFEADTQAGRWFDFSLIAAILLSVAVVMLDSAADQPSSMMVSRTTSSIVVMPS